MNVGVKCGTQYDFILCVTSEFHDFTGKTVFILWGKMDMMLSSDKGEHDITSTNTLNYAKVGLNEKNAHIKFACWYLGYVYVL